MRVAAEEIFLALVKHLAKHRDGPAEDFCQIFLLLTYRLVVALHEKAIHPLFHP
jgi:hypothetical protein